MSNMSYCKFQNTLSDLRDCSADLHDRGLQLDGLDEYDAPLSADELRACTSMLELCRELAEHFEDELGGAK